jgi:hypothetical protein
MIRVTQSRNFCSAWILIGVLWTLSGCKSGRTPTYADGGQVQFKDGKPLTGGFVVLKPLGVEPALNARGFIQSDGTFLLGTFELEDGAIEGEHQALITPPGFRGKSDDLLGNRLSLPATVDVKYQAFEKSGFKCMVTRDPSKNQFVLIMERPKG